MPKIICRHCGKLTKLEWSHFVDDEIWCSSCVAARRWVEG